MVESDARLDELLQNSSLRAHPTRCTPREGFSLGKLASYAICQELIRNQPTRILFVSLPGHGTATGGRHVGALLRNISQLVLTHLEREDSELIIDGTAGNPAWNHSGLDSLKAHPRWKKPLDYFWCNSGALLEEKPFRRRSHVMTTIKLPTIKSWNTCCGKPLKEHITASTSRLWKESKPSAKRYPPCVWKGFILDMERFCLDSGAAFPAQAMDASVIALKTDRTVCDKVQSKNFINTQTGLPSKTRIEFSNQDHIRHFDKINVDRSTDTITREVRVKCKPEQLPVSNSDAYPLRQKKNAAAVVKKPIVWPKDSELKAQ